MACYYSSRAVAGLGGAGIVLGILRLIIKKDGFALGISAAQLVIGVLAILFPLRLTGLCAMHNMQCHIQTFPSILVVSILLILLSGLDFLFTFVLHRNHEIVPE